jgi:hypothetical protein
MLQVVSLDTARDGRDGPVTAISVRKFIILSDLKENAKAMIKYQQKSN